VIQSVIVKKHLLLLGLALGATPVVHAQHGVGELFSSDASVRGSVLLSVSGTHVLSGSQVTAGDGAALLKLERGGDLLICPKTNLSLSADAGGKALVLGLNEGSMELDYALHSAVDTLVTPDFRVQLISPGTFHFAISVASSGDTCVHSLAGNDAALFIAEMMGGDSYQLSPGKSVMFRGGKIAAATEAPAACGCPELKPFMVAPESATLSAETPAATVAPTPANNAASNVNPGATQSAEQNSASNAAQNPASNANRDANQAHLEVNGSFIYRGNGAGQDYYSSVARLSTSRDNSQLALALLPQVSGPAAPKPAAKKEGALHRFGNFLGHLFGR
jgi:hypothetical protein